MPDKASGFLRHLLGQVAGQGRGLIDWAFRSSTPEPLEQASLVELVRLLLSTRGEASGVAIAREIMTRYAGVPKAERVAFLVALPRASQPIPSAFARPIPITSASRASCISTAWGRRLSRPGRMRCAG